MAGQIVKRNDRTWIVRIFTGCNASGKRRYVNKTIHGTRADAQKYLNAKLREKDLGLFVEPTKQTINEFLDYWLKTCAGPRLTERGLSGYELHLKLYVRPALGELRLSELRHTHIQGLYGDLLQKGLDASTVRHAHTPLASALKQALREGAIAQDPTRLVELPRLSHKEMHALSDKEAMHFLEAASSSRWQAVFALALSTGMRPEEYFGLQWKDIDFGTGKVSLQRGLIWRTYRTGDWYFGALKTKRSRRTIPLPVSVIKMLAEHRRRQSEQRLKAGPAYQNHDLVFATKLGGPLQAWTITRKHFRPILKRAGLPQIRLYDLRHTFATLMLKAGKHPKVVSDWMGHSSVSVTLDTYSHVQMPMMAEASEAIESMLFAKVGTL